MYTVDTNIKKEVFLTLLKSSIRFWDQIPVHWFRHLGFQFDYVIYVILQLTLL